MTTYNGHKNWAHWNVSLWLTNDEGLYRLAEQSLGMFTSRRISAQWVLDQLHASGIRTTPDGARYNKTNILAVLRDLE